MTTMTRSRAWRGPAVLSYGFRPFFLLGGLQAALMIALWAPWFLGFIAIPSALPPIAWHAHELLFGFVPAVVAGFLMTAVPNWTGRLPVVGVPLAVLVSLWLVGRIAIAISEMLPAGLTAGLSLLFPLALFAVIGREIVAGRNWRNLKVWLVLALLAGAQAFFHYELWLTGQPQFSTDLAIAAIISLIMIIGGRVTPSFTINWLKKENPGPLPAPFSNADRMVLVLSVAALLGWILRSTLNEFAPAIAVLMLAAAAGNLWRQARWTPHRTLGEPLVMVLHAAYAFICVGFLLNGIGVLLDDTGYLSAGLHAWTTGTIGLMTLAMMTRATRGHTGRSLTAPAGTIAIYLAVLVASLVRIAAALAPEHTMLLLPLAALAWTAAFAGFAGIYGPMLLRPKSR